MRITNEKEVRQTVIKKNAIAEKKITATENKIKLITKTSSTPSYHQHPKAQLSA